MTSLGEQHLNGVHKDWILKPSTSPHYAKCRFCHTADINMKSMGNSALVSHAKSVKHQKAVAAAAESGTILLQASVQRNVNVDTNNSNSQSIPANNSAKSNSSVNVTKTATLDTFFGTSKQERFLLQKYYGH